MTLIHRALSFWFKFPQPIRYIFIGGFNTVFAYALYCLIYFLYPHHQGALLASFLLSTPVGFLMQKYFVFATQGNCLREYLRCLSVWIVTAYGFDALILEMLVHIFNPYLAQMIAQVIVAIITWFLFKYFAFRRKK